MYIDLTSNFPTDKVNENVGIKPAIFLNYFLCPFNLIYVLAEPRGFTRYKPTLCCGEPKN